MVKDTEGAEHSARKSQPPRVKDADSRDNVDSEENEKPELESGNAKDGKPATKQAVHVPVALPEATPSKEEGLDAVETKREQALWRRVKSPITAPVVDVALSMIKGRASNALNKLSEKWRSIANHQRVEAESRRARMASPRAVTVDLDHGGGTAHRSARSLDGPRSFFHASNRLLGSSAFGIPGENTKVFRIREDVVPREPGILSASQG